MNKRMFPARVPSGNVPNVQVVPYTNGQTFVTGAVLIMTSAAVLEATSTVAASQTNLYGIALQGAATNPGYDAANSPTVITGRQQTVSVARFDNVTIFQSLVYNGTTQVTTAATIAALVGTTIGLRKLASGIWVADTALTGTSGYCMIQDWDQDTNIVLWKMLPAAISP